MVAATSTRERPGGQQDAAPTGVGPPVGWIAAGVFMAVVAVFFFVTIRRDGSFTYPLDDSYIHLRLGSNLAHGTLGMNPGEFASTSSSPIWPVLIAAVVLVTGPLVGIPLALAMVASVALLVLLDRWAVARSYSVTERAVLMGAMILVVPMTSIAVNGMEHALQIGGVLLLISLVIDRVDRLDRSSGADVAIFGAALLCAATRFETVFLVVPLGVLLIAHRRWRSLFALGLGSLLPIAVVGAINLGQGWPALPASVLIKSSVVHRFLAPAVLVFLQTRLLFVMCLAVLLWWLGRRTLGDVWPRTASRWTVVAVSASVLNIAAGLRAQVYRYEAYLVAACVVACAVNVHAWLTARREGITSTPIPLLLRGAAAALAASACVFGVATLPDMSNAVQEVHLQQVQMARFSASACPGCTVVVNDIGKVSLDGDVRIVDDVGLADLDVLRAKQAGTYDSQRLDQIAVRHGATLAMVYPHWPPLPPTRWERIGSWHLPDTRVVGGSDVAFYSLDPSRTNELRQALAKFEVPSDVTVTIDP